MIRMKGIPLHQSTAKDEHEHTHARDSAAHTRSDANFCNRLTEKTVAQHACSSNSTDSKTTAYHLELQPLRGRQFSVTTHRNKLNVAVVNAFSRIFKTDILLNQLLRYGAYDHEGFHLGGTIVRKGDLVLFSLRAHANVTYGLRIEQIRTVGAQIRDDHVLFLTFMIGTAFDKVSIEPPGHNGFAAIDILQPSRDDTDGSMSVIAVALDGLDLKSIHVVSTVELDKKKGLYYLNRWIQKRIEAFPLLPSERFKAL